MSVRRTSLVLVVALALTGTACGGGDDGGAVTSGATDGQTGGGESCSADTATDLTADDPFTIVIQDLAFDPSCFSAASASSIVIENRDSVTHTFTIDGTDVDVEIQGGDTFQGASAGLAAGTYPFHCRIHASMTGTVIVT
jgi:plastocyanin